MTPSIHHVPVGEGMTILREERIDRLFATRVEEVLPSGCHIWTGDINDRGYGLIRDGKKSVRAHRVAWERENGPIPDGRGGPGFSTSLPPC